MAKKKVEVKKVEAEEVVTVKAVEEVKATTHPGVYAVKFTHGNLIQTELTWDQAQAKVEALERQDKILKEKSWTPNFYKIIKC